MYIIYWLYTVDNTAFITLRKHNKFQMLTPSECVWMVPGTVEY